MNGADVSVIRVQEMHFTEFGGMRNKVLYLCLEDQENCSMVVRNCLITYIVISRKPPESTTKCCVPSELLLDIKRTLKEVCCC